MKYINIPLNAEEIESLHRYFGFRHAEMNVLGDLEPRKIENMQKSGWSINASSKDIEQLINDFVNVYGVIYNQGDIDSSGILYRGTSRSIASNIREDKENTEIISTTTDENIAKTFCEYGNATIMRIRTSEGLPHLYAEEFKEENSKNEQEVLILPFSKVKQAEFSSNWNGYTYYNATLEKGELPEIATQELEYLKQQCIQEFDDYLEQVSKYNRLNEIGESLFNKISRQGIDKEELNYLLEKREQNREERYAMHEKITEYKNNFSRMLKGLCRQREIKIDKQKEDVIENVKKEAEKREKNRQQLLDREIRNLKLQIDVESELLYNDLSTYINTFNEYVERYKTVSASLGLQHSRNQHIELEIKRKFEEIQAKIQENYNQKNAEIENKDEQYLILKKEKDTLSDVRKMIEVMPELLEKFDEEGFKEIKYNLNRNVQELIYKQEMRKLQMEKDETLQEKQSIFEKIFVGSKLKDAKLQNIESKMQLARREKEIRNPDNRVREMLQDIYNCAYKNFNGQLTLEMEEIVRSIRKNFQNIPTEPALRENAIKANEVKALIVVENKKRDIFKKNEIKDIQAETDKLNSKENKTVARQWSQLNNVFFQIKTQVENIYKKLIGQDVIEQNKSYYER